MLLKLGFKSLDRSFPLTPKGEREPVKLTMSGAGHLFPLNTQGGGAALDLSFSALQTVPIGEVYEGPYAVTPSAREQQLPTEKKIMMQDLTVHEIPFFEVSNTAGGSTVYIGGKIEIY